MQLLFKAALKRVQQVSFPNFLEIVSSTENHKGGNCVKRVLQKAGAPLYQLNPQPMEGFEPMTMPVQCMVWWDHARLVLAGLAWWMLNLLLACRLGEFQSEEVCCICSAVYEIK